ncbi:MAG: hypothetical protein RPV21_15920 [Candidatus Sedimenticola sp. (ex Thyasira tokunagai)]
MAALTEDRATEQQKGKLLSVAVAAGVVIHGGALVVASATGYAQPGATGTDLTALGMATERVDNSAGADGEQRIEVRRGRAFKFENDGGDAVGQANLLQNCYIVDDQTVAATDGTGTRSIAGKVVDVDADGVWVEIG